MEENKISSRADFLKKYHDIHMDKLIAFKINLEIFKNKDKKEVVEQIPVNVPGRQEQVMRTITAEMATKNTIKMYNMSVDVLTAIEKLLADEGVEIEESAKVL